MAITVFSLPETAKQTEQEHPLLPSDINTSNHYLKRNPKIGFLCTSDWTRGMSSIHGVLSLRWLQLSHCPIGRKLEPLLLIRLFLSLGFGAKMISPSSSSSSQGNRSRKVPLADSSLPPSSRQSPCPRSSSEIVPCCFFAGQSFWFLLFTTGLVIFGSGRLGLSLSVRRMENKKGYSKAWVIRGDSKINPGERSGAL